jgi:integrase
MSRQRNAAPAYIFHKQSGRGRLVWTDRTGTRQQKLLPGPFNSPESLAAKARLELELATSPIAAPVSAQGGGLSLAEVLVGYLDHAEKHYRGLDGQPTSKLTEVKIVLRSLRQLYAELPVTEFTPLKLKAVRQGWVDAGIVRSECNRRVGMVKRVFKWAVSEELTPPAVFQALATVSGLQRGRTTARESEPVGPVDDVVVDATVPFLNRHVRGLVEFQRLTGCRPGEACGLRRCDIDTSSAVWFYNPRHHKTAWKGKTRSIAIGPQAQEVLKGFPTGNSEDFVFSPRRAVEECLADRAARRKTPLYPSHAKHNAKRRVKTPKLTHAECYNRSSYAHAVCRACDRAFSPVGELARRVKESRAKWWARLTPEQREEVKRWQKAHRWHPNQLRHAFATRVRKQHGLEAAQVLLGHARADVTQIYAERNEQLAAAIATQLG